MAIVQPPPGLLNSGPGIVRGTAQKIYANNKPIIAALLISEVIETGTPGLGAIPVAYNLVPGGSAGKKAFLIAQLAAVLEIFWLSFPNPPIVTSVVAATYIVNQFGADKVVDSIDKASSGNFRPDNGYLYCFENDTLGISAGIYSVDAVFRASNNSTYKFEPTREWVGAVDWIPGIPNLSWIGDWFGYEYETDTTDPYAVQDDVSSYNLDVTYFEDQEEEEEQSDSRKTNIGPLALAAAGYFVAGPLGAAIGFGIGSFVK